jgi:phospholipid transport system substrate-binding protein
MRKLLAALSLSFVLLSPQSLAEGGPGAIESFKASHNEAIAMVDAEADTSQIEARVDELLDYEWIAKEALGGPSRYDEVCGSRCDEFNDLLIELIRERYLKAIRKSAGGELSYGEAEVGKDGTTVNTEVKTKGSSVEIDYLVGKKGGKWKVRDITTDDVSLVSSIKKDTGKALDAGGMDQVIVVLEGKTRR